MTEDSNSYFIPSSYSRIVARELDLQERDLPKLLQGTGLSTEILLPGDETHLTGQQQLQVPIFAVSLLTGMTHLFSRPCPTHHVAVVVE